MKKFLKGLGLVLIWELIRYMCSLLLFMFLGKVWIIIIATIIFVLIIGRFIFSLRYSDGGKRRCFTDIISKENRTDSVMNNIRNVVRYTDVKIDIICALLIMPLPAIYISKWPSIMLIDDDFVILFVILVSVIGVLVFTVIDVFIWMLIHRSWSNEYKLNIRKNTDE